MSKMWKKKSKIQNWKDSDREMSKLRIKQKPDLIYTWIMKTLSIIGLVLAISFAMESVFASIPLNPSSTTLLYCNFNSTVNCLNSTSGTKSPLTQQGISYYGGIIENGVYSNETLKTNLTYNVTNYQWQNGTVEFWAKADWDFYSITSNTWQWEIGNHALGSQGVYHDVNNQSVWLFFNQTGGAEYCTWNFQNLELRGSFRNIWHHYAYAWRINGSIIEMRGYLDGIERCNVNNTNRNFASLNNLITVGSALQNSVYSEKENNTYDEFMVSNYPKSANEIYSDYRKGVEPFSFFGLSTPLNNYEFITNQSILFSVNATIVNDSVNCSLVLNGISQNIGIYQNDSYFFNLNTSSYGKYGLNTYYFSCSLNITNTTISTISTNFYVGGIVNISSKLYNGSSIQNFNISYQSNIYSTATGNISLGLDRGILNYLIFDTPNYQYKLFNISFNATVYNYNVLVYLVNTVNITVYDELTGLKINNVTLDLISDIFSNNYSTTVGNFFLELLSPTNYIARYQSQGYSERFHYFTLTNRTYNEFSLYLIPNTTSDIVTATVVDELNNPTEDVYIKVLKFNTNTNSYELKETSKTNFEGKAYLNLELNTEFYKFMLEYPLGTLKTTTSPSYITSTTINFRIYKGTKVLENFFKSGKISSSITFNNETNYFRFDFTDSSSTISQGCLYVYDLSSISDTLINSTCISSASGSILIGVQNISGKTYEAKAYVYYGSEEVYIDALQKTFKSTAIGGKSGALFVFILTLLFICMGFYSRTIALILAPIPTLLASFLGIMPVERGIALLMVAITWSLAFIISRR